MAKKVKVKTHALERWKQRVRTEITKNDIELMFQRHRYEILKIGYSGRLVVKIKDYVFVIFKTDTCITICTTLGLAENVNIKPKDTEDDTLANDRTRYEITRWNQHLKRRSRKGYRP